MSLGSLVVCYLTTEIDASSSGLVFSVCGILSVDVTDMTVFHKVGISGTG